MTAYALCELEVSNLQGMQPYLDKVAETIASHGGKYLVAGQSPEVIEGGPGEYPVKVILEFPSVNAFKAWYSSAEYQALLPYRQENSRSNFYVLEGVPTP